MAEALDATRSPRQTKSTAADSFADMLDRVVWDYSSRGDEPSPLVPTAIFFEDFPWDGEEIDPSDQD